MILDYVIESQVNECMNTVQHNIGQNGGGGALGGC